MIERLERAEFPYVREKLVNSARIAEEEVDEAIFEFRRYMALSVLTKKPLAMLSPVVDEVWHQFILFTRLYGRFCDDVFGYFIHHLPDTSHTPLTKDGAHTLIEAYEQYFGPLTRLWVEGKRASCSESCASSSGDGCHGDGSCGGDGE